MALPYVSKSTHNLETQTEITELPTGIVNEVDEICQAEIYNYTWQIFV